LADAWGGFRFRTVAFYWVKTSVGTEIGKSCVVNLRGRVFPIGLGYYTRANPEQCWLFTRGKNQPFVQDHGIEKLVLAERRRHSEKPREVHTRIERLIPCADGKRLELFARSRVPGWVAWGDEVGGRVANG
jgi:N6-adenosine-specific RNA methylase IME4